MTDQALELLSVRPGGVYVDCTVGLGGHAELILEQLAGSGLLIGLDRDRQSLELARGKLEGCPNCRLHHENFKNLPLVLGEEIPRLDGCLVDLGVSSLQLDSPERGFSFRADGPLDMRMDPSVGVTAAQLLNQAPPERLARIFREYGEETRATAIAEAIARRRRQRPLTRTSELAELVAEVARAPRQGRIHPATRVFQALRIEVNQELSGLESFLEDTIERLADGGRLVVIAFHSLEDRIVKRTFRKAAGKCVCFRAPDACSCPRRERVTLVTRRPLRPAAAEVSANPRARSARLRAVEKLPVGTSSKERNPR